MFVNLHSKKLAKPTATLLMDRNRFYFKQFSVAHTRSALKVGVDGVLVGLWSRPEGCRRVLDAGTGCGVIALIVAQLTSGNSGGEPTLIEAIDIDAPSVKEAADNFRDSPWSDRLGASPGDLREWPRGDGYDLIVSNPPFFRSGVGDVSTSRMAARHQESLPLADLLSNCARLLRPKGRTVIILPYEFKEETMAEAAKSGLKPVRLCRVRGHANAPWKRILLEFVMQDSARCIVPEKENYSSESANSDIHPVAVPEEESLTLETSPGVPTEAYRRLGRDFYLKF